jgi:hypothetical protein
MHQDKPRNEKVLSQEQPSSPVSWPGLDRPPTPFLVATPQVPGSRPSPAVTHGEPDARAQKPAHHCEERAQAAIPPCAFVRGNNRASTVPVMTAKPGGRTRTIGEIQNPPGDGATSEAVRSFFIFNTEEARGVRRATERNRAAPSRTNGLCDRLTIEMHRTTPPGRLEAVGTAGACPAAIGRGCSLLLRGPPRSSRFVRVENP